MNGFSTSGTQIIDPNGDPFIAKGVATFSWPTLTNSAATNTLLSDFPGINMIRLAADSGFTDDPPYNNTPDSVASLVNFIDAVTAKGIVVEIEDHTVWQDPDTLSGSALSNEVAWYASLAAAFESNPYVWFGTMNEPLNSADPSAIQAQELAIYSGIRATGNTAPILLELSGGTGTSFAQASAYAPLQNVVWDIHSYGQDTPGVSTNQAAVTATLDSYIAAVQTVKMAPVIIGEYGPATTVSGPDVNATEVENAVWDSGLGSIAWAWGGSGPDAMGGPGALNAWGQQVASYIGTVAPPVPSVASGPSSTPTTPSAPADDTLISLQPMEAVATQPGSATVINAAAGGGNVITSNGSDTVNAEGGLTEVFASGPSIVVNGGSGALLFVGGTGNDTVEGGSGPVTTYGGTGPGSYSGGTNGQNILVAGDGNTTLRGAGNGDELFGAAGSDGNLLQAGAGNEVIVEGNGATTVEGGPGTCVDFGGTGMDTYLIPATAGGEDLIVGFKPGIDLLQVSGGSAEQALSTASVGSWGTSLNLADGTLVVLFGVQNLTAGGFA